jgi:hypothetical protein
VDDTQILTVHCEANPGLTLRIYYVLLPAWTSVDDVITTKRPPILTPQAYSSSLEENVGLVAN